MRWRSFGSAAIALVIFAAPVFGPVRAEAKPIPSATCLPAVTVFPDGDVAFSLTGNFSNLRPVRLGEIYVKIQDVGTSPTGSAVGMRQATNLPGTSFTVSKITHNSGRYTANMYKGSSNSGSFTAGDYFTVEVQLRSSTGTVLITPVCDPVVAAAGS